MSGLKEIENTHGWFAGMVAKGRFTVRKFKSALVGLVFLSIMFKILSFTGNNGSYYVTVCFILLLAVTAFIAIVSIVSSQGLNSLISSLVVVGFLLFVAVLASFIAFHAVTETRYVTCPNNPIQIVC